MFIDIHVHVKRLPGPQRRGKAAFSTPDQLLARLDELGVERAVLLPLVSPEAMYVLQTNEEILEVARAYPDRFVPFCNVDPRAMTHSPHAPLGDLLAHYRAEGCRGLGEVTANLPLLHPQVQNLFRHAQEARFPLTFHIATQIGYTYGLYDDTGLPQLETSLGRYPDLIFLGHSPPFWAEIGHLETPADRAGYPSYPVREEGVLPRLFRRYPNLYGDLSAHSGYNALARDRAHAARFLDEFQDRLLFGTDICAPDTPTPLAGFLQEMRDAGEITEAVFAKVARENARRVLGLHEGDAT